MDDTSVSSAGSGCVPLSGIFSIRKWAEFCEVSNDTINRWVEEYAIPYFQPGKARFIRAEDFISKIPFFDRQDE